ncbi:MAG: FkbM family methyltransferase [Phycisphaerales bacterium]|nr:FkbM family methyltransferase [Phycisphaerales bacterium]
MDRVTNFNRLRAMLAPAIRPVLEWIPPVRWLAMKVLARRQPAVVEVEGLTFEVHPADFGVTFEIAQTGDYEPATRHACMAVIQEGDIFIDIGAHVGLFAVPAAMAVGGAGRVIAFEPDPANRGLLEVNIARHELTNVDVMPFAVADQAGSLNLRQSRFNTGDHRLTHSGSGMAVDVVSLDAWCAEAGVSPSVIKMDVQGGEPAVLAGMNQMLHGTDRLHLFLEFAPAMIRATGADPRNLLEHLQDAGFVLNLIDERDGAVQTVDVDTLMRRCPDRGYVNVHAAREQSS